MRRVAILTSLFAIGCTAETIEPLEPVFSRANGRVAVRAYDLGSGVATDINVHGEVVGYSQVGEGMAPWIMELGVPRRLLPIPPPQYPTQPSPCSTVAMGINDRRQVAGSIQCGLPPRVQSYAIIWSRTGEITLGEAVDEVLIANAINNRGTVVGTSIFEAPIWGTGAWYWEPGENIERVAQLGIHDEGTGADVNSSGRIAGSYWSIPSPEVRAYVWSPDPTDQPLVLAPDNNSRGYAIDARGRVGGTTAGKPAIWNPGGDWSLLPDLGYGGVVNGMSTNGVAVGRVESGTGAKAAYWNVRGDLQVLEPLDGFEASSAVAVNQRGWVIGQSWNTSTYESRATLWTVGAPLPGRVARPVAQAARSSRAMQPFAATAVCTEKWRHFVQAGGTCPEEWRGPRRGITSTAREVR